MLLVPVSSLSFKEEEYAENNHHSNAKRQVSNYFFLKNYVQYSVSILIPHDCIVLYSTVYFKHVSVFDSSTNYLIKHIFSPSFLTYHTYVYKVRIARIIPDFFTYSTVNNIYNYHLSVYCTVLLQYIRLNNLTNHL